MSCAGLPHFQDPNGWHANLCTVCSSPCSANDTICVKCDVKPSRDEHTVIYNPKASIMGRSCSFHCNGCSYCNIVPSDFLEDCAYGAVLSPSNKEADGLQSDSQVDPPPSVQSDQKQDPHVDLPPSVQVDQKRDQQASNTIEIAVPWYRRESYYPGCQSSIQSEQKLAKQPTWKSFPQPAWKASVCHSSMERSMRLSMQPDQKQIRNPDNDDMTVLPRHSNLYRGIRTLQPKKIVSCCYITPGVTYAQVAANTNSKL